MEYHSRFDKKQFYSVVFLNPRFWAYVKVWVSSTIRWKCYQESIFSLFYSEHLVANLSAIYKYVDSKRDRELRRLLASNRLKHELDHNNCLSMKTALYK